ncbi:hypothetical protein [Cerasicoccus frondis]|uniref:hypothetical protein n=1 Tax=Cerasicoccus frondis TaxID=490090 RepID=UPI002852A9F6|nr:hypothetical protein [Cerasicoccus frondis]
MNTPLSSVWSIAALATFSASLSAQMVINGDFSNGIVGEATTMSGSAPDVGGDGSPIDDGWIEGRPGDVNWIVGSGSASRSGAEANPFNPIGIGQLFSNPAEGGFANGETITYSLDYDLDSYTGSLQAVLYGVTGPRDGTSWATFTGEGINLNAGVGLPAGGANYSFTSLIDVDQNTITGTGIFTQSVTLSADYSYFFVGFAANPGNSSSANTLTLNSVSVAAVPEPETMSAWFGGAIALFTVWRLRRRR